MALTWINDMTESEMFSGLNQMGWMNELKIESNKLASTLRQNRIGSSRMWGVTLHSWFASIDLTLLG